MGNVVIPGNGLSSLSPGNIILTIETQVFFKAFKIVRLMLNSETLHKSEQLRRDEVVPKLIRSRAAAGWNVRPVTTVKIPHNATNYLAVRCQAGAISHQVNDLF